MLQTTVPRKKNFLRVLARVLATFLAWMVLAVGAILTWFFYYSGDLPDIQEMARYAPRQVSRVTDPCHSGDVVAISYDAIGYNFRAALNSAEGYDRPGKVVLPLQISRMAFCEPSRGLERRLKEARLTTQLKRRFSQDELLTIYANRAGSAKTVPVSKLRRNTTFIKSRCSWTSQKQLCLLV